MKYVLLSLVLLSLSFSSFAADQRKPLPVDEKKEITEVLNKNDELFNAFLKQDAKVVEKKASELNALIKQSKSEILKKARTEASTLTAIKSSNENDANLASYEKLSNQLIDVVKNYDVGSKFNVFSCPMVKKSWLQNVDVNKEVKNVYATYMLECGTQDTKY